MKETLSLWIKTGTSDMDLIYSSLATYIPNAQEFILKCFESKLFAILNYAISSKLNLEDFHRKTLSSFCTLYETFILDITSRNQTEIDSQKDLYLLKEIPKLYLRFYDHASSVYNTFKDRFNAFDIYVRLLALLITKLHNKFIVYEQVFFDDLFSRIDDFTLNMSECPKNLKPQFNALKTKNAPTVKWGYKELCRKFKHIKPKVQHKPASDSS